MDNNTMEKVSSSNKMMKINDRFFAKIYTYTYGWELYEIPPTEKRDGVEGGKVDIAYYSTLILLTLFLFLGHQELFKKKLKHCRRLFAYYNVA
jgi:hypothetical protein